jgi:MoaA/NifB/PqqE/SkfB family radical SAM enzyme
MRFPLALTAKIASHIVKHKLRKTPKFAMVLQLEPLHTCNLTCTGCGRIREYSTNLKDMMSLEDCLASAQECEAPMVSICGGEPLIYPKIEELIAGLREQGRVIYICTNGVFMRKKMRDYMAAHYTPEMEARLVKLLAANLVTEKEAEAIRKADDKARAKVTISPSKWMYWNVHVDGLEYTHDLIVEREGVFKECIEAIKLFHEALILLGEPLVLSLLGLDLLLPSCVDGNLFPRAAIGPKNPAKNDAQYQH